MIFRSPIFLAAGLTLAWPAVSAAHVQIRIPKQRHIDQKAGPCGVAGGTRGENVCEFRPGSTITLEWDETIDHPGHFRVSFDQDGIDDLVDPIGYEDFYTAPSVLLDDIADRDTEADGNPRYSVQVELPDIECDNCTLQLIQVMTDKMPWGPGGGNDIYFQCADIVLSSAAPEEPAPGCGVAPGGADAGSGGGSADAGAGDAGSGDGSGGDDDPGDDGASDPSDGCTTAGASAGLLAALLIALVALRLGRRDRDDA